MGSRLGDELRAVRKLKELSLKAVADPAEISTAYLQKLEQGEVKNPSPNVLHRLAAELGVSYAGLMELAGYIVPSSSPGEATPLEQAFNSEPLTQDERRAVAAFIGHLREQRQTSNSDS
jgi:HTH-type transcriptional regulator, competence development regulator